MENGKFNGKNWISKTDDLTRLIIRFFIFHLSFFIMKTLNLMKKKKNEILKTEELTTLTIRFLIHDAKY